MNIKRYIGKLVSAYCADRKTPITGFVVNYNTEWTLLKYNPVDYIIDGYVLLRNSYIQRFIRKSTEKWKEHVITLKDLNPTAKDVIPLTTLEDTLQYLTNNFGLFQFYKKSETACYVGQLQAVLHSKLIIRSLDTRGEWDGEIVVKNSAIRVIEYDTDYLRSLKLVADSILSNVITLPNQKQ